MEVMDQVDVIKEKFLYYFVFLILYAVFGVRGQVDVITREDIAPASSASGR